MGSMRTITQHAEVLDLALTSIIVDDTDTPMQVIAPNMVCILAGPDARTPLGFRAMTDPEAIVLPVVLKWEPVS